MMKFASMTVLALMLSGFAAGAHEYTQGSMFVHHPAVNATPKGASVAAGYMTIKNNGDTDDRLTSITAPGITDTAEIHSMTMDGGVMKMRKLEDGVAVPAGQTVALSPHGDHVMFMAIKQPLTEGATYDATLHFEKAGDVAVKFNVEPVGSQPQAMGDHEGHAVETPGDRGHEGQQHHH